MYWQMRPRATGDRFKLANTKLESNIGPTLGAKVDAQPYISVRPHREYTQLSASTDAKGCTPRAQESNFILKISDAPTFPPSVLTPAPEVGKHYS
jgi:hypothetical protein